MLVTRRAFIKLTLGMLVSSQLSCDLSPPVDLDKKKVLLVYWIISILQPINKMSIITFIKMLEDHILQVVSKDDVRRSIKFLINEGYLIKLLNTEIFSTSPEVKFNLSTSERLNRDRLRFFLLKNLNIDTVGRLRESSKLTVDGDPPSIAERLPIQLRVGFKGRHSQTLNSPWVSSHESTLFAASPFPSLLSPHHHSFSYPGFNFIEKIKSDGIAPHLIVRHILAYDLGFSVQIISRILANKNKYYRHFEIRKKSGGTRKISSPKTYLKIILIYIKAYLFTNIKVHKSVHSYQKGKSFLTNAEEHVGQKFVLNIDLENYFASIHIRRFPRACPEYLLLCFFEAIATAYCRR